MAGQAARLAVFNPRTPALRQLAFDPRPGQSIEAYNLWMYRGLHDPAVFREAGHHAGELAAR